MTAPHGEAAPPPAPGGDAGERSDLFLCYARRDSEYVTELVAAIRNAGLAVWVDLADIPPADPDWPNTVDAAIIAAPALLFVLTPDSAHSDECRRELDVALAHGKQIIVVSHRPLDGVPVADAIRRSNWIKGTSDAIGGTVAGVVAAYTTDLAWKRYRAELEIAATRWRDQDEDPSYLLRGRQLDGAEREVAARAGDELPPTDLLISYLRASREALAEENRRRADSNRVAVASEWLERAPTTAAVVLLEIEEPDRTPFAVLRMNEVLERWLVWAEWRPTDHVGDFDLSADGDLAVLASSDGKARIWRIDGEGELVTVEGVGQLFGARFSADGKKVVVTGNGGQASVWRSDGSGQPLVFEKHGDDAQFSPDGRWLAMTSEVGTCRLHALDGSGAVVHLTPDEPFSYELDDLGRATQPEWLHVWTSPVGVPGRAYAGPPLWYWKRARAPLFSADGRFVVVGSLDGIARVWQSDGRGRPVELRHGEAVLSACFSADGHRVLTASYDGRARVWPADGAGDPVGLEHGSPVVTAVFSPDGSGVATGAVDGMARVWPADGSGPPVVLEHPGPVFAVSFSQGGERLLTLATDGVARLWSIDERTSVTFRDEHKVVAARFAPRGDRMVTASETARVRAWSYRRRVFPHHAPVQSVRLSPDGGRVLTAAADNATRLWAVGDHGRPLVLQHAEKILTMCFSPDGKHAVSSSADGTAWLCRADGSAPSRRLEHERAVNKAVFDPTGTWLATGSEDGFVRLWRTDRDQAPVVLSPPGSYKGTPLVRSVAFSPAGDRVVATGGPAAHVWSVEDPSVPVRLMARHYGGYIESVGEAQFSSDGDRVVTLVEDKVRVWRADGGGEPVMLTHGSGVSAAVISPDGSRAATVSAWDGTARIWDLTSVKAVAEIRHGGAVESALFSPDGQWLAITTGGRTVGAWRADGSGEPVTLRHDGKVASAAFSPDGGRIATVSADGSAWVWPLDGRGDPFVAWHDDRVHDVSFGPDGHSIVTASEDGTARVWLLSGIRLREEIRRMTRTCLGQEFYERFLGESPEEARRRAEACEGRQDD